MLCQAVHSIRQAAASSAPALVTTEINLTSCHLLPGAPAIRAVFKATGLTVKAIDIFEINEAFASQAVYVVKDLKIPREKVNPNGGAIALVLPLDRAGSELSGLDLKWTLVQSRSA
ncbi:Thiolase, C-terminal domain-containing protein [Coprinopsis sp. MPI-PUGE-AT-0042]|nr:Thiolase, C-terminal domain-containing protein [Coprinopsis sp. MPI-PUGE-AT-0042]